MKFSRRFRHADSLRRDCELRHLKEFSLVARAVDRRGRQSAMKPRDDCLRSVLILEIRGSRVLFALEHLDRVPCLVGRCLFVFERAFQVHLRQRIVRIEFEKT